MRVATMLLFVLPVLGSGGCALEGGAPGEQQPGTAALEVSTGLPECDEYLRAYLACGARTPARQTSVEAQSRVLIESFRRMALDPKVADAARSSCRQASSAVKQSAECR